jgi:putative membrane protein
MVLVTEDDKRRVAEAIARAESATSGEIVAMIAPESGSYLYIPFLWAGLAALAVPWPLIFWTWWPVQSIYLLQLAVFGALVLVLAHRPLRFALVPRSVKRARAHRRALEQFLAQNLYTTVGRTGVLIFVSVAEGFAEIIADSAIHARVPKEEWDQIVADLTAHIGREQAADGFVGAIDAVGRHLARHFPAGERNPKSLTNHLIVLPAASGGQAG